MRSLLRYLLLILFLFTISLYPKVRHIYEVDGAQAIQDSIDVSDAGDTVMVHNGKYYIGDLSDPAGLQLQGKRLMSVSPDSASECILTGLSSSGLDTAFNVIIDSLVDSCYSVIQGFTITHCLGESQYCCKGGGINVPYRSASACSLTIRENIIKENFQCGVSIYDMKVYFHHNKVSNNNSRGIFVIGLAKKHVIKNNIISGNKGGGLYIDSGIADDILNSAKVDVSRDNYSTYLLDNLIIKNYAPYGGGVVSSNSPKLYIEGNTFVLNKALKGGALYNGGYHGGFIEGKNNAFIANRADTGGFLYLGELPQSSLKHSLVIDNGSYVDNSGSVHKSWDDFYQTNKLEYSNIYYNTYQEDIEILNRPFSDTLNFTNNFWWVTDSASIDSLISGPADFIPFEPWFVDSAPGEPTDIYSVLNYNSDYSTIVDSLSGNPDTLYLEITGHDRHSQFQEAAVAILKSNIYSTGIAVALLETDTASGIYRWKGIVKTTSPPDSIRIDDINQTIRVDPDGDTIKIIANLDNSEIFKVYYRCQGGMEGDSPDGFVIQPLRNPVVNKPEFRFFLPEESEVKLSLYDVSGRMVDDIISEELSSGWHTIQGDVNLPGVYIYRIRTDNANKSGKVVVVE